MPRPLRIEFPDACYHVSCRGQYSFADLGQRVGPISLGPVGGARTKMRRRMPDDSDLEKRITKIISSLDTEINTLKK